MLLAREFGWTIDEIKQLTSFELNAIVDELLRQKEIESIAEQYNHWAFLAAVISNSASAIGSVFTGKKGKEFRPEDFIVPEILNKFKNENTENGNTSIKDNISSLIQNAKAKGLKGPW